MATKTNNQSNNQTNEATEQPKSESTLYSVYGARISKSGERVNVSLVKGQGDTKTWACISVKLDNKEAKVQAQIKNGFAYIKIPLLVEDEAKKDTLDF